MTLCTSGRTVKHMTKVEEALSRQFVQDLTVRELSSIVNSKSDQRRLDCPSAPVEFAHAVFAKFESKSESHQFLPSVIPLGRTIKEVVDQSKFKSNFRLVGRCVEVRCANWSGGCVLGSSIAKVQATVDGDRICPISKTCRWKAENGDSVCGPCSSVRNIPVETALNT